MGAKESALIQEFAEELCKFIQSYLREENGTYISGAIKVLDARNHLFQYLPDQSTDESMDIYSLSELCEIGLDEEGDFTSFETQPSMHRALSIARNYF